MKNIVTILLIAFSFSANAQFYSALAERSEKAKDRILLLESGDFECSDDIESYFEKHWKIGIGIEVKTSEEINALLTPENAFKYMVLACDEKMEAKLDGSSASPVFALVLHLGENAMRRNDLDLNGKFVFKVSFPSCIVSEAEVLFICQHFENFLANPATKFHKKSIIPLEKIQSVQNLTLLIPDNATELSITGIKKAYKYPIELVAPSEIEKHIFAKTAGFAYVNILWSDKRFAWESIVVSCENSEVLATAKNDFFKASLNKKKWENSTQILAISRSKSKLATYEFKTLNKTVLNAINKK